MKSLLYDCKEHFWEYDDTVTNYRNRIYWFNTGSHQSQNTKRFYANFNQLGALNPNRMDHAHHLGHRRFQNLSPNYQYSLSNGASPQVNPNNISSHLNNIVSNVLPTMATVMSTVLPTLTNTVSNFVQNAGYGGNPTAPNYANNIYAHNGSKPGNNFYNSLLMNDSHTIPNGLKAALNYNAPGSAFAAATAQGPLAHNNNLNNGVGPYNTAGYQQQLQSVYNPNGTSMKPIVNVSMGFTANPTTAMNGPSYNNNGALYPQNFGHYPFQSTKLPGSNNFINPNANMIAPGLMQATQIPGTFASGPGMTGTGSTQLPGSNFINLNANMVPSGLVQATQNPEMFASGPGMTGTGNIQPGTYPVNMHVAF